MFKIGVYIIMDGTVNWGKKFTKRLKIVNNERSKCLKCKQNDINVIII